MDAFRIDTSRFPLVISTLPVEVTDANLEDYFRGFERLVLARAERFASVVDARPLATLPSTRLREKIGHWQKAHPEGEKLNCGIAFVTERALVRGFMAAVGLIYRPVVPTEYLHSLEAGIAFAQEQLQKR